MVFLTCVFLCSCKEKKEDTGSFLTESFDDHEEKTTTGETVIHQIIRYIRDYYLDIVLDSKLLDGAIQGILKTLDPYSSYISPEDYAILKTLNQGEFHGVGIEIIPCDEGFQVITAINGTPAERAGIVSGDIILKINGQDTKGKSIYEIYQQLHGQTGTSVLITAKTGSQNKRNVTLDRANIKIKSVENVQIQDEIVYVRIRFFNEKTADDLKKSLMFFLKKKQPIKGCILDLRDNPGGVLEQAVQSASLFLSNVTVMHVKGRNEADHQEYKAEQNDILHGIPLVVLINKGSASGAEVVASALKENKRAILMGEKTFGKGTVQTIFLLANQGALKLTTGYYYSPRLNPIDGKGVEPDLSISEELANITQDHILKAAYDFFKNLN